MIQVLCHELYHRYQHYQVNLLQAIRDNSDTAKYANLLLLDTAGIYEDEYSNYISPDDDSAISYYMYNSQRLERDAEKYSNASVVDYYEQICSYLESNYKGSIREVCIMGYYLELAINEAYHEGHSYLAPGLQLK